LLVQEGGPKRCEHACARCQEGSLARPRQAESGHRNDEQASPCRIRRTLADPKGGDYKAYAHRDDAESVI
jgi:hypothetical protein